MSAQCKTDYVRAFDATQKRVAARAAVRKLCERELVKLCGGVQKDDGNALGCILAATRGVSAKCNQAISEAGFGAVASSAQAQPGVTTESWINELAGLETPLDIDVAALRQQALERVKSKTDGVPLKRPPVAAQLLKLPNLVVEIQFDEDSPIVRPESYRVVGRIADALYYPALLPYKFLIVRYGDHQPEFSPHLLDPHLDETGVGKKLMNYDPRYYATYYAIDAINFEPVKSPAVMETIDAPYLPLVIQEAAGIPLDPSFEEQKKIMLRCKGLFYACKDGAESRRFNRLLIDAGLVRGL